MVYMIVRRCMPIVSRKCVHSGDHGDRDGQSKNIPGDHGVHDCTPMYTDCLQSENHSGDKWLPRWKP